MKFEIKRIGNGIQELNRLKVICDNRKELNIDIWDNELLMLKRVLEEYIEMNDLKRSEGIAQENLNK